MFLPFWFYSSPLPKLSKWTLQLILLLEDTICSLACTIKGFSLAQFYILYLISICELSFSTCWCNCLAILLLCFCIVASRYICVSLIFVCLLLCVICVCETIEHALALWFEWQIKCVKLLRGMLYWLYELSKNISSTWYSF